MVPSFGVAMQHTRITLVSDFAARNMPLLLLDSRPMPRLNTAGDKAYGRSMQEAEQDLYELEKELFSVGTCNRYHACTLAHLHAIVTDLEHSSRRKEDKNRT